MEPSYYALPWRSVWIQALPMRLKEALARRDADKWREAIANKIVNFL